MSTAGELSLFGPEHWDEADAASPSSVAADDAVATQLLDDMKWAINYVKLMDLDTVRLIAMETSIIVQSGYHADHLYVVNTLHGERMNGQKMSALCYACFMRAFPSMIEHLSLNYFDLYQAAIADD